MRTPGPCLRYTPQAVSTHLPIQLVHARFGMRGQSNRHTWAAMRHRPWTIRDTVSHRKHAIDGYQLRLMYESRGNVRPSKPFDCSRRSVHGSVSRSLSAPRRHNDIGRSSQVADLMPVPTIEMPIYQFPISPCPTNLPVCTVQSQTLLVQYHSPFPNSLHPRSHPSLYVAISTPNSPCKSPSTHNEPLRPTGQIPQTGRRVASFHDVTSNHPPSSHLVPETGVASSVSKRPTISAVITRQSAPGSAR